MKGPQMWHLSLLLLACTLLVHRASAQCAPCTDPSYPVSKVFPVDGLCYCLRNGTTFAIALGSQGQSYILSASGGPTTCPITAPYSCVAGTCCYATDTPANVAACPITTVCGSAASSPPPAAAPPPIVTCAPCTTDPALPISLFFPPNGQCYCLPSGSTFALEFGKGGAAYVVTASGSPETCPTAAPYTCLTGQCCYASDTPANAQLCPTDTSCVSPPPSPVVRLPPPSPAPSPPPTCAPCTTDPTYPVSLYFPPNGKCYCLRAGSTFALEFGQGGTAYVVTASGDPESCPATTPYTCLTGACCFASDTPANAQACPTQTSCISPPPASLFPPPLVSSPPPFIASPPPLASPPLGSPPLAASPPVPIIPVPTPPSPVPYGSYGGYGYGGYGYGGYGYGGYGSYPPPYGFTDSPPPAPSSEKGTLSLKGKIEENV